MSRKFIDSKWWPETGSVSRLANEICNLQILKSAESANSARMPKRSCKSLAKFILGPEGSRRRALVDESVHRVVFEVDAAPQSVGNGLGVAIVPSALARTSADSGQIHSPRLLDQDLSLPKWRAAILTRSRRKPLSGKKTVDLFSRNPRKSYESSQIRSRVIVRGMTAWVNIILIN